MLFEHSWTQKYNDRLVALLMKISANQIANAFL